MSSPSTGRNRYRSTYSLLLTEIRSLRKELQDLKTTIPSTVTNCIENHDNLRKLVVSGLPEGTTRKKVSQLLLLGGVPSECVLTLVPLGRPKPSGPPRPICVELSSKTVVPHLKTLATTLKTSALFSGCSVRLYETPEQRHQGYLQREARRKCMETSAEPSIDNESEEESSMDDEDEEESISDQDKSTPLKSLLSSTLDQFHSRLDNLATALASKTSPPSVTSTPVVDQALIESSAKNVMGDRNKTYPQVYETFDALPPDLKRPVKDYIQSHYRFFIYRDV